MFVIPSTEIPPAVRVAAETLRMSNELFDILKIKQKEAFNAFWRPSGVLRSKEEINEILDAIDAARPGQSIRLFLSAKELAELLMSIEPESLGDDDWKPPYEYAINNGQLRVV